MKIELYSADWCSSCKTVKPIIEAIEGFEKEIIDVEKETERAVNLNIRSIPVIRVVKDDTELARLVGNKTKQEIEEIIGNLI